MTDALERFVSSKGFQSSVLALIVVAALLVGLETSPAAMRRYGEIIRLLNDVILWAFVAEAALKMAQHGLKFWWYFRDPWNIFDFAIIAVCFLPINAQFAAVLRLARVFRSLRLVTALPRLQILVNALLKSIPSMAYVGMLLFLLFYVYGVMGVFLFRKNDPVHFINLPTSMLTLFRVVTQEDWTDVMYIQMYGSDIYAYANTTGIEPVASSNPVLGALFFVSFVFLGTMILLNLFIGVIINSMEEVRREEEEAMAKKVSPKEQQSLLFAEVEEIDHQLDAMKQRLQSVRKQLR